MIRNRTLSITALVIALSGVVALAGCKKHTDEATGMVPPSTTAPMPMPAATIPPPPATTMPPASSTTGAAPTTGALTVSSVDLGSAVGTDNRVAAPMTEFTKADTIHASVATDGGAGTLGARWTYQDGQVVHTEDKSIAGGPQVTDFSITKPGGWPAGKYKLELSLDGNVVQTREFAVK